MCGIAGIVGSSQNSEKDLKLMLDSIAHRGPDDSGAYVSQDNKVFLGSRRLSIIDLSSKGRMPMSSADNSVVVCQNGEIYNYPEIKKDLERRGYAFRSNSDTEIIVYGYKEWGTDVFKKLRGMFAIAIYDVNENKVLLVRDRIGIKPLYYLVRGGQLFFSSEAKAFASIGFSFADNISIENVNTLLGFMFLPNSSETILEGVKKLPPGSYIELNPNTTFFKIKKYWDLAYKPEGGQITFREATDSLDILLRNTVKAHLLSDVPLGVMLSGGLDSSLITSYVQELSGTRKVATFNASFNHKLDESMFARDVAKHIGTNHTEIRIDTSKVNANIEKYIRDFDDLTTFDGGLITTKILCKEIKDRGITVLLLGEGADEVFGGYSWFGLSQLPFSLLPRSAQAGLYYYAISRNVTFKPNVHYPYWKKVFMENYNKDIFRNVSSTELKIQLPNHLLMKVDKASMAASVEARVPYLDHKVVEFAYSLPRAYKLKGDFFNFNHSNEKYILREVARRYLPEDIVSRKKRGFMIPMLDVLRADLSKVRDYVFAIDSLALRLLERNKLEDLFEFNSGSLINMQKEYLLWRLFLLEVWKSEYGK